MYLLHTPDYDLTVGGEDALLLYATPTASRALRGPVFEVDGEALLPRFSSVTLVSETPLNDDVTEYAVDAVYALRPTLTLRVLLRVGNGSPILKFKYLLMGDGAARLTKTHGERLDYGSLCVEADERLTEVRFSEFNEMLHSFCMNEVPVEESAFAHGTALMGPLMAGTDGADSYLLAYEHGSQYPDAFIQFRLSSEREMTLAAKKGNYLTGILEADQPLETVWLDFGMVHGDTDALAAAFRAFQLKYVTMNRESRKPYIFYNTWCYQERNCFWNHRNYLAEMDEARMLTEIDAAHEMGIDVFVIDTGWYEKTGDWLVNRARFADGMKRVCGSGRPMRP